MQIKLTQTYENWIDVLPITRTDLEFSQLNEFIAGRRLWSGNWTKD